MPSYQGAQVLFTLPPIDEDHIFRGFFRHGTIGLEGLHHIPAPAVIPAGVITVANHAIMTTNAAGGQVNRIVNLRLTPAQGLVVTGDAPFEARVEVIDPGTNVVIARKNNSSFFPMNWTRDQIAQAIYEAATNYVTATGNLPVGRTLPADTDLGVRLLLHTRAPAGVPIRISSGYPRGAQPAVTAAHVPLL
jgi:Bacterial EndoU nuclease